MKKRFWAALLTIMMAVSALTFPAGAVETVGFPDVSDPATSLSIETLRLMGVLDGYGDGTFRPANQLTRAQFCKMAAYVMDGSAELGKYRTVTIFPDVKPSHWAATYINFAAKGRSVIAGFADGKFHPERAVTVGQAVTILLRLLGYKDEEVGGVWPDSYMAVGAEIGLTDGVGSSGSAALTRAQAAKLFLNLLDAEKDGGGTLYTLSKETQLYSVDGSTGTMKTAEGTYEMVHPVSSTSLVESSGRVVLNEKGKALTFLPATGGSGGISNAAVVIYADRATAGLSELAGTSNYTLYKNGIPIGIGDLRKNDVATYNPDTNSIRVCDTRVSVYYESCEPRPDAPTTIQVLGGTTFSVLPTAMDSLAAFKPGEQMTLLLTADGQVAAAVENSSAARSNAMGIVSGDGAIELLCGNMRIPISAKADAKYHGQVVRISASKKDEVNLYIASGRVSGDLDTSARVLESKKLAENVMIFDAGEQTTLAAISAGVVKESQITYARTNWAGNVDLIVMNGGLSGTVIYGKAVVREETREDWFGAYTVKCVKIECGNNQYTDELETGYAVRNGEYVAATIKDGRYTSLSTLTRLNGVSSSSWVGKGSVLFAGRSYSVPVNVLCYNLDSKDWVTLEQALAYSNTANLYTKDGVVHIVEVTYK